MKKISLKKTIDSENNETLCDFIAKMSGLSKIKVKDAMQKGALQIKKGKENFRKVRRAKSYLTKGSQIEFHYDEKILSMEPLQATIIHDQGDFSSWFKPSGMLTQGSKYGDHCSLLRFAELFFTPSREIYPLHRLDREASGIVLMAHNKKTASKLSSLFSDNKIYKEYKVQVIGQLEGEGLIDRPLDGKKALTKYRVINSDPEKLTSTLIVSIETGRLHQIRRHLDSIKHAVIGDPKYGRGNKNKDGMRLAATRLKFKYPLTGKFIDLVVKDDLLEW